MRLTVPSNHAQTQRSAYALRLSTAERNCLLMMNEGFDEEFYSRRPQGVYTVRLRVNDTGALSHTMEQNKQW